MYFAKDGERERRGRSIVLRHYCCRCTATLYNGQAVSRYVYHFILFRKTAATVTSRKRQPRKTSPPSTFYYLESYFAVCLLANRIVISRAFCWTTIVPILGIANRRLQFKIFQVAPTNFESHYKLSVLERTFVAKGRINCGKTERPGKKNNPKTVMIAPFVASCKLLPYGQPRRKTGPKRERTSRIQSTTSKLFRWLNFARRLDAPWPRPPRSRDNSALRPPCLRREERRIRVNVAGLKKKRKKSKKLAGQFADVP